MKTKILILSLVLSGMLPMVAWAQLTYTTNNGAITITGYTGSPVSIVIPASTNGYPVTRIGVNAFYDDYTLKGVTIPNSVTNIGISAFEGTGLKSVIIPNSITMIGSSVFYDCESLTNVTIPNSVTSIGDEAFLQTSALTGVTIPNSVASIGVSTFYNGGLTSVMIPNSVRSIGASAFYQCFNLTNATISYGVTAIGAEAFMYCTDLMSVTIPNSVTTLGDEAFGYCYGGTGYGLTSVTIGNGVTSLGNLEFYACSGLTNITFFGNAPAYGSSVFNGDPATVYYYYGTSGWGATYDFLPTVELFTPPFTYTTNTDNTLTITGYTGPDSNVAIPGIINGYPVTIIGNDAFDGAEFTGMTIPNGVTSIEDEAFEDCENLTNVTIPNSVTNIGNYAFNYCVSLPSVTIPNGVTSIGVNAFSACSSLVNVNIPNSVTSIGDAAFASAGLMNMTIPASVTSLGNDVFDGCENLTNITFLGNVPGLGANVFFEVGIGATVYYYYGTSGWGVTYGGLPAVMLGAPAPQINGSRVQSGNFNSTITGVANQIVIVEASTNLVNWQRIWTNTLSGPSTNFVDSHWTNYPSRFYRAR